MSMQYVGIRSSTSRRNYSVHCVLGQLKREQRSNKDFIVNLLENAVSVYFLQIWSTIISPGLLSHLL